MATTLDLPTSAWIASVQYVRRGRTPDVDLNGHDGLLITTMRDGRRYVAGCRLVGAWAAGGCCTHRRIDG